MTRTVLHLLALMLFASAAIAETDKTVRWQELSATEQRMLGKFMDGWDKLPAERQNTLRKGGRALGQYVT